MDRQVIPPTVRRWLNKALPAWQSEGLIGPDQAGGILALYEDDEQVATRSRSLASFALMGMGSLLFGLALLLLIGFNWEYMPAPVKLAIILGVVAGTHSLGFRLRATSPRLAEIVFFMGCLFYGCGIWLVAQVFHIDAHYPDGVWWWALGVLPFALLLDSLLLHLLFAVLISLWAGMEVFNFLLMPPWWLFGFGWLPNGAFSLPLLVLPCLVWGYRKGSPAAVGLYVAVLAFWVVIQAFVWQFGFGPLGIFWVGCVGVLLLILAEAHEPGDAMAIPYRVWGTLMTAGMLVPMSSWWFWTEVMVFSRHSDLPITSRYIVAALLAFLAMAVASGLLLLRVARHSEARRTIFLTCLMGLMFLGAASAFGLSAFDGGLIPTLAANAAMIGLSIYLINVGAKDERVRPFGAGVLYFLVWAIARYVDLFQGAGGMLAAAAIFALCGVALFVIARFWAGVTRSHDIDAPRVQIHPWQAPAWIVNIGDWFGTRAARILVGAAIAQVVLLVGMIGVESLPYMMGRTVVVKTMPVDPRDFFRGDFVILDYEFNRLRPDEGRTDWLAPTSEREVFVTLEPEPDGKHWRGVRASRTKPSSGVYIVGRPGGPRGLSFGIEQYFVQEGKGLDLERLRNKGNLSAEIAISPWGRAKIVRLIEE